MLVHGWPRLAFRSGNNYDDDMHMFFCWRCILCLWRSCTQVRGDEHGGQLVLEYTPHSSCQGNRSYSHDPIPRAFRYLFYLTGVRACFMINYLCLFVYEIRPLYCLATQYCLMGFVVCSEGMRASIIP
jgi:hypothetical protein